MHQVKKQADVYSLIYGETPFLSIFEKQVFQINYVHYDPAPLMNDDVTEGSTCTQVGVLPRKVAYLV